MKVSELIDRLKSLPQDVEVVVSKSGDWNGGTDSNGDSVFTEGFSEIGIWEINNLETYVVIELF